MRSARGAPLLRRMKEEEVMAMSEAEAKEMEISAAARAGASLMPSPRNAMVALPVRFLSSSCVGSASSRVDGSGEEGNLEWVVEMGARWRCCQRSRHEGGKVDERFLEEEEEVEGDERFRRFSCSQRILSAFSVGNTPAKTLGCGMPRVRATAEAVVGLSPVSRYTGILRAARARRVGMAEGRIGSVVAKRVAIVHGCGFCGGAFDSEGLEAGSGWMARTATDLASSFHRERVEDVEVEILGLGLRWERKASDPRMAS